MADPEHIQAAWQALGRRLAELRQARGHTQEQFAGMIYVSRSSVANVETGRECNPPILGRLRQGPRDQRDVHGRLRPDP